MNAQTLNRLQSTTTISETKWRRNARMYYGVPFSDLINVRDLTPVGLQNIDMAVEDDVGPTPYYNVIKAAIDRLTSKMAQSKVRAGLLPNGKVTFKTRRIARSYRDAIDWLYKELDVSSIAIQTFRSACIFERAFIFVDPFSKNVVPLFPWEVGLLPEERRFGNNVALVTLRNLSIATLKKYYGIEATRDDNKLEIAFDVSAHKCTFYLNGAKVRQETYGADRVPLIAIEYTPALNGYRTTSVVDELFGIQTQLNKVNAQINECAGLTPGVYIVGPAADQLDQLELTNGNGRYIGVRQNQSDKIVIETPKFISEEWFQYRDTLIEQAYDVIGINDRMAKGKNPMGAAASGAALETLGNLESENFQVQLDAFVRMQEDIARLIVVTYPDDFELSRGVTIKDVKETWGALKLCFASLSWMSRDPQTRYNEIVKLASMNLISHNKLLGLMEFGDLTQAYDFGSAFQDSIERCIEKAIDGVVEVPTFIEPTDMLTALLLEINQHYANMDNEDKDDIAALEGMQKLLNGVKGLLQSPGIAQLVATPDESAEAAELTQDATLRRNIA